MACVKSLVVKSDDRIRREPQQSPSVGSQIALGFPRASAASLSEHILFARTDAFRNWNGMHWHQRLQTALACQRKYGFHVANRSRNSASALRAFQSDKQNMLSSIRATRALWLRLLPIQERQEWFSRLICRSCEDHLQEGTPKYQGIVWRRFQYYFKDTLKT